MKTGQAKNEFTDEDEENEPKTKKICLQPNIQLSSKNSFELNKNLLQPKFIERITNHWENGINITTSDFDVYKKPFHFCILKDFFNDNVSPKLIKEMLELKWHKKHMDLYEFHQSNDLSTIKEGNLKIFFNVLQTTIKPLIEKICKIDLQHISASCSMYNSGDYLLAHDDLLTDRQIAFIYYISPWKNVKTWSRQMGGGLEMLGVDSNILPQLPAIEQIFPKDNNFVFFKVSKTSFHQVTEVTNFNYPRLTINGWFHGDINKDLVKPTAPYIIKNIYNTPNFNNNVFLGEWINTDYLKKKTIKRIQKHIENNSEISLVNFLQQSVYQELSEELQFNKNLIWINEGPVNSRKYERLDLSSIEGKLKSFATFINSSKMYKFLYKLTCLDLYGKHSKNPTNYFEIQKWTSACYTALGNESLYHDSTLDLILYFNATDSVGVTTYLTEDPSLEHEASETNLLTINPKNNVLSIVYSSNESIKFTKYVSNNIKISKGPVYIVCSSYKE